MGSKLEINTSIQYVYHGPLYEVLMRFAPDENAMWCKVSFHTSDDSYVSVAQYSMHDVLDNIRRKVWVPHLPLELLYPEGV